MDRMISLSIDTDRPIRASRAGRSGTAARCGRSDVSLRSSVHFELVQDLQAGLPAVEAAYLNDDFLAELGRLPKLGSPVFLDRRQEGGKVRQRVRYAFVGQLSSAVTAVVDPKRLTWVDDALLDPATHTTTFRILPDHYAGLLRGSRAPSPSRPAGTGTTRRTEGELKVRVPFVAGKVETAIISGLRDYAAVESEALDRWIANGSSS